MRAIQALFIKLVIFVVLVCGAGATEASVARAKGSELAAARTQFEQGDIMMARDRLKQIAPRLKGEDRTEAFKLLGVCYFLTGQRDNAKSAFQKVLKSDPDASLDKRDILDPSLVDFFAEVKKSTPSRPQSQRKTPSRSGRSLAAKGIGSPGASASSQVAIIFVNSNAPAATVFANGLFIGTANQPIELPPGSYKITVTAAGYSPSAQSLTVSQGDRLQLTFNLEDPEAIERRKQLAQLKRKRKAAEAAAAAKAQEEAHMRQLAAQMAARKQAEAELLALERREAEQKAREQQKEAQLRGAGRNKQLKPAKRSGKVDYQAELPPGKQTLADEFKQDQIDRSPPAAAQTSPQVGQRAVPQQNAQPLQQQYAAPQQYGQPPQQYGQPPQQYGQPPQQYAQPPQQYAQPPQQAYVPPPQPYPQAPVARVRKSKKSAFIAVMPFGVGQFQNDSYTLGATSAVLQVCALGWGIYSYTLYSSAQTAFQEESKKNAATLEQQYVDDTQAYLARWKLNSAFGFIGFGVIWIASGIEALASLNDGAAAGQVRMADSGETSGPGARQMVAAEHSSHVSLLPVAKLDGSGFGLELKIKF